jgi:hypothetical protein
LTVREYWREENDVTQFREPELALRQPFFKTLISGDSGSGGYIVVNGDLVILCCWTTSIAGSSIARRLTEIQSAMDDLETGYTLDVATFT